MVPHSTQPHALAAPDELHPKYTNLLNFFLKKALCHFRLTREKDLVLNPAMISTNSRSERGFAST